MDKPELTDAQIYDVLMQIITSSTIKIGDMPPVQVAIDRLESLLLSNKVVKMEQSGD